MKHYAELLADRDMLRMKLQVANESNKIAQAEIARLKGELAAAKREGWLEGRDSAAKFIEAQGTILVHDYNYYELVEEDIKELRAIPCPYEEKKK